MKSVIENRLLELLPRDLLLDLMDMANTRALAAHETIRDNFPYLDGKNARAAEGQVRFRVLEQGLQSVCELHGAQILAGGLIEGTDLRFFQPLARFGEVGKPGVILGLASMPARGELPNKNMSRKAAVTLNYHLTPRLPLDGYDPQPGDIFVLLLVARDPSKAGFIEEIAIGLIDTEYQSFIFYETMEEFMVRYAPPDKQPEPTDPAPPQQPLVRLKGQRITYKPPEDQINAEETKDDSV